ncbi:hypothetical protein [Xylanimonas oleitrophica]|uniref:hypothetical protein n=1 Tax=Xylanimonas oleitrophica TaxID=2607479 RepID=UPI0015D02AF4|nr:hypothetical protein [Xylanimonas oleitrophica]
MTSPAPRPDDERPLDPADTLRVIQEAQRRARAGSEPDARLLYATWGAAWLGGYLTLWAGTPTGGDLPAGWAFAVFTVAMATAVVVTVVHSVRRTAGTRGVSARVGTLYGWSWFLGFLAQFLIVAGLARAGAPPEAVALAANAIACLIVGLLYLAGAMLFDDRPLVLLGGWILLVAAAATMIGVPGTYLLMALAGGGGFLVMGAVEHARAVRARRAGQVPDPRTSRA